MWLTRRGGVVVGVVGCIGSHSLLNENFMLVFKKKERKKKLTWVLKGPVLRTACGPETGPKWTEMDRTFGPGPCF